MFSPLLLGWALNVPGDEVRVLAFSIRGFDLEITARVIFTATFLVAEIFFRSPIVGFFTAAAFFTAADFFTAPVAFFTAIDFFSLLFFSILSFLIIRKNLSSTVRQIR